MNILVFMPKDFMPHEWERRPISGEYRASLFLALPAFRLISEPFRTHSCLYCRVRASCGVRGGGVGGRLGSPVKHDLWDKVTHPLSPGIKFPPTGGGGKRRDESTGVLQVLRGPVAATFTRIIVAQHVTQSSLGGPTAARSSQRSSNILSLSRPDASDQ